MMSRFSAVYIALIAIVHLPNGGIFILADNLNPVCTTTECQRLGKIYLQNIDPLERPCSDFYDYVCGNWGRHNPRPKHFNYQYLWDVGQALELRALEDMRKLLESKAPSTSIEFEQAKILYSTCVSMPYMERSSPSVIWNVMKKIAPFPILTPKNKTISNRPFFWEIDEAYIRTVGDSAFFEFIPALNASSTNDFITNLQYILSAYGSLYRPTGWPITNEWEHYKTFLTYVVKSIADQDSSSVYTKEVVESDIEEVKIFREKLNWITTKQVLSEKVEVMTIDQFQSWYTAHAKSQANDIKWLDVISSIYTNSNNPRKNTITQFSKVAVPKTYFSKLAKLLRETSKRTIVNHIHLYFAEKHMEWTPQMKAHLEGSIAETRFYASIRSPRLRWERCIQTNIMKTALGKAYASSNFPPKQKSQVFEIFKTTKRQIENQITQSTWLDSATKNATIDKLAKLYADVGYPDWYDTNEPPKLTPTAMDPILPTSTYNRESNDLSVTAATLQWPIYSPQLPYVIDYGSVSTLFGHELYYAFDSDGIRHDAKGKSPFWPRKMLVAYENKTQCFKDQYNKYKIREVNLKLDKAYTTPEDISDAMGLKAAYHGFKEMLQKNNGVCPILPGFKEYGCEKLFFIAFGNKFCSAPSIGYQELVSFRYNKNLPKVRVNAAVGNMKEFSSAFGCKSPDVMSANQSCDLWQP